MSNVIPFEFDGEQVRTVTLEDGPYFVGKDVAERLGYTNPSKALNDHCKGVTKRYPLRTTGGIQEVRVISEPDVLRLIISSKLPSAERFEAWVFEEVLPAIRKTGGYIAAAPDETPEQLALRALTVLHATVERQKAQIAEMEPMVEAYTTIATAEGSLCITDAAKTLKMRPKDLFSYLTKQGWIYRRAGGSSYLGYQTRTNAGDLSHKVTTVLRADGSEKIVEQVVVTAQGLAKLAKLIKPLQLVG